ncbi:hypothetical protein BLOT_013529 [Blomia tropicalis]|nr:hypothetical protein BLOT_013529 [Blomia tropicalis]
MERGGRRKEDDSLSAICVDDDDDDDDQTQIDRAHKEKAKAMTKNETGGFVRFDSSSRRKGRERFSPSIHSLLSFSSSLVRLVHKISRARMKKKRSIVTIIDGANKSSEWVNRVTISTIVTTIKQQQQQKLAKQYYSRTLVQK